MNCFRNAAEQLDVNLKVVAVDMDPSWSPACQGADYSHEVDRCTSHYYIEQVLEICHKHRVKLIVPTIDTELLIYAENRHVFEKAGVQLHLGSSEFVRVARDKALTAQILDRNGIPIPRTWNPEELLKDRQNLLFPLMMKPKGGSCSKGIEIVSSLEKLEENLKLRNDYLIQELCAGREYTVNCFYDRQGMCVACVPHFREFVRDGEVCLAQTERIPEFTAISRQLGEIFNGIWGCICFQGFRQKDDSVRVFEINARFGGGYPICDVAGGTFARWILQDLISETPDYHDEWKEGVRMLRYDEAIFTGV